MEVFSPDREKNEVRTSKRGGEGGGDGRRSQRPKEQYVKEI